MFVDVFFILKNKLEFGGHILLKVLKSNSYVLRTFSDVWYPPPPPLPLPPLQLLPYL